MNRKKRALVIEDNEDAKKRIHSKLRTFIKYFINMIKVDQDLETQTDYLTYRL